MTDDQSAAPVLEQAASFSRSKPRWWTLSIAYRLLRLARLMFGDRLVLRLLLNLNWITWRLAHEVTGTVFGYKFVNETYAVSAGMLTRYVPTNGTVIDIGCGSGRLAHLMPPGCRFVGFDRDAAKIAEAQRSFDGFPLVTFQCHDLTAAWPKDAIGDVALLVGVLEHVDDAVGLLRRLHAVAPTLIVEVPDLEATHLNWARRQLNCPWYTDADHVREYTKEMLNLQLVRAQWTPIEWVHRGGMVLAVSRAVNAQA